MYGYVSGNPVNYFDYYGLEKYDVNMALDVIRNNTSMNVPDSFNFEPMGPGLLGSVDAFSLEMTVNSGIYDGALDVLQAYDLFNTVVHETIHYNSSLLERLHDAYIDPLHPDVYKDSDDLAERLWEKFYWEWENNKYAPGSAYCS